MNDVTNKGIALNNRSNIVGLCHQSSRTSKHLWNTTLGKVRGSRNEPCTLRKRGKVFIGLNT